MLKYHRRGRRVPVAVGTILYVVEPRALALGAVRLANPWIVEGWHTREYAAARKDERGRYISTRIAGGHLATIRSLRDGRRAVVADWLLRFAEDL